MISPKNDEITIGCKKVTKEYLEDKAADLQDFIDILDLITSSMDHYLVLKEPERSEYFMLYLRSGEFGNTVNILNKLTTKLQALDSDFLPDSDLDKEIHARNLAKKAGDQHE